MLNRPVSSYFPTRLPSAPTTVHQLAIADAALVRKVRGGGNGRGLQPPMMDIGRRGVLTASLFCVSLTGCGTMTSRSTQAAPSPLMAACAEFYALRDKELGTPQSTPPQPLAVDNAREFLRRAEAFGFSGGFQLTQGGRTLASEGYGMANRVRGIPVTSSTIFDIGSLSKQFTAAAILRLEEMGRLRTDDPISRHLPGVPADKQAITIHHLLTHSAGLPHDVGDNQSNPTRDEAVRQMLAADLKFGPGTKHSYTNVGYALLAAIVETASRKSFERFMRDELWRPLGMRRTGMVLGGLDKADVAEGYMFDGPLPPNRYRTPDRDGASWRVRGAGYILSTMPDLERWGEALRTGRILSDSSRRKLFRPHVRENGKTPSYYGYGWALFSNRDGSCRIAHDGSAGVHYDFMSFFPERDAVLTTFSTQQRAPWRYFIDKVYPALAGSPIELPPVAATPKGSTERLIGDYRLPNGASLPVQAQDGRLYIEMVNADLVRLFSPWPMLPPERTASLGDRQALISSVMAGISNRDYGPLMAQLRKSADQAEEKKWWDQNWPEWTARLGSFRGADLVGTAELSTTGPTPVAAEDCLQSLALLRFDRGTVLVGFAHDPDGRIYVDWMPHRMMRDIFLAPQEDGSFLAYSPSTKRTVRGEFSRTEAGRSLLIDNGQERVRAVSGLP